VPLLRVAYELWDGLQRRAQRRLHTPSGGLTLGRRDWPLVSGVLASALEHGLEVAELDPAAVAERFPQFHLAEGEVAVFDPAGGVLDPRAPSTPASAWPRSPVRRCGSTSRSPAGGPPPRASPCTRPPAT
jgi:sarcosine oxidase